MDSREFRNAMGRFATGVTVITTNDGTDAHGMTANAFMSISLEPKLITISIDNHANMLKKIKASGQYAVNFLSDQQQDISMNFAGQKKKEDGVDFGFIQGVPVIKESLASVVCDVEQEIVVGDHTLFIGSVKDVKVTDGNPLTFYCGKYGDYRQKEYA
ncbi:MULTISPECIES: flavin reductase family protein [Oceanobacillus]|uniref:Flavin reductase n=1 Tax=Oceanobacillus profundus TaxID=372463 RepID=A0A417YPF0_9BACI|nr:flavin reductase family protein [Oceanobacillus profundus]MBR3118134.1 flavin reductase family protein [Oceanobacillus sp.]MCM3399885.1 flavin reductase family protein [Oceanobacillus profundus]PAE30467.1 flavin reductase [Paenibacillus sp. 7884-2]RHW35596.1 flavin reductase [Oceanobacillus profundus]